jgi:hypothetical protein
MTAKELVVKEMEELMETYKGHMAIMYRAKKVIDNIRLVDCWIDKIEREKLGREHLSSAQDQKRRQIKDLDLWITLYFDGQCDECQLGDPGDHNFDEAQMVDSGEVFLWDNYDWSGKLDGYKIYDANDNDRIVYGEEIPDRKPLGNGLYN